MSESLTGVNAWSPVNGTEFATTAFDRLRILRSYRTIAMVGLSSNLFRPSHFAAIYMLAEGYNVIPVNPREQEILGRRCYPSLRDIPEPVEIVDIFRDPAAVPPIVEEAITIGAKVVWMQLGVINHAAAQRTRGRARGGDGRLRQNRARALLRRPEHDRPQHRRDHGAARHTHLVDKSHSELDCLSIYAPSPKTRARGLDSCAQRRLPPLSSAWETSVAQRAGCWG